MAFAIFVAIGPISPCMSMMPPFSWNWHQMNGWPKKEGSRQCSVLRTTQAHVYKQTALVVSSPMRSND
jgi:hypothetical protein